MKQAGRKSAAELATVTNLPLRTVAPPADLSAEEAGVWSRVVQTKPGEWWDAGNLPLLTQYCRAVVQAGVVGTIVESVGRAMLTDPDELPRYKELRKIQAALSGEIASLARSMRLTQQSQYRADAAAVKARKANGRKPWLIESE